VTDHRGSKQGLWDAEDDAESDRPTLPEISDDEPTVARMRPEPEAELDSAIELLRVSIPPAEPDNATGAAGASGTMSPEAIDSVARFISDPGLVAQNGSRELDAPSRSLAALELLDGPEYGAEPTDMRPAPLPPALPGSIRPPEGDLPSILLGSQVSTRGEQTERMMSIPMTHPLANSIAPGGSAVSTPPRTRRTSRWQVALGVAALLGIGFGASRFLQSRGEHHAASGLPSEDDEDETSTRREEPAQLAAVQVAATSAAPAEDPALAAQALADQAARSAAAESARRAEAERQAREALEAAKSAKKARSMRVAMGGVRMINRASKAEPIDAAHPDRARVVAAMNAMTEQLRGCVGDEHGVADVTLTVRAPGVVSHALVEGSFAGSPKGTCIARAMRTAKLPEFADPVTRIEYPFQL
jgi:hypothetical protein